MQRHPLTLVLGIWALGLLWSGVGPYDRLTWFLEVAPVLAAAPLLWATAGRFRFSTLAYLVILAHGLILMVGGAYSYARVPFGDMLEVWLHLSRNPYDKIGHFAQGFAPAIVARELLVRRYGLAPGRLLGFLAVCICGSISAAYEIIEWQAAIWLEQGADAFLGAQGDPWDTQSDMLFAFIGAATAVTLFAAWHDRSMRRVASAPPEPRSSHSSVAARKAASKR